LNNGSCDFGALVEQHFDAVYGFVAYRVAPDIETARDITQEVFLTAVQRIPTGLSQGSTTAWLMTVARNKTVDHFRSRRVTQALNDEMAALQTDLTSEQERATLVSQVIRILPPQYAELLELKYIEGCSVREIVERTNSTQKAVESSLVRAREAFRKSFAALQAKTGVDS
jgi:RNA polymerase sigma-70 factor, ECF subfamily